MGAIPGFLGLAGGQSGTGLAAPAQAGIVQPVNAGQIQGAYGGAQGSLQSQQALLAALQAQGGLQNQNQVYGQLQGVVGGTGPNPAQAMLNQATGQNIAAQSALMAGQRGAAANPGLIARQAAMQGANLQQQAVGQGATLQAQQSLAALGAAGQLANQQAAQQIGQTNANVSGQLGEQQALLGAQQGYNAAAVGSQGSVNQGNTAYGTQTLGTIPGIFGSLAKGASSAGAGAALMAKGGQVQSGPRSSYGKTMHGMAEGGKVPAMLSPGEIYLNPGQAKEAAHNPGKAKEIVSHAGKIPGKARVAGDSRKNDTVPTVLETGGVVVPRTKTMPEEAARFIKAALAHKGKK